ncbi:hypothetical protein DSM106972_068860 [Dulcicalothrix desertica PCC 7102]|uniref:Uncharacterized protein n=1 Tax=Dulcicalothrix desertica PCC 7102 TaxID=232991 RepID=A0A3S1C6T2_9CYAN|nr:hypothetical protein [Dulcicalothrix desertica]RUT01335.1 hypothetical protein DSM106972_068860 [Dulcicalothrix desertica PCC 7102]
MSESQMPLYSPYNVDLKVFNAIKSPDNRNGKPIKDMQRFFYKQIVVDDETIISTEPFKVPGYIGIANSDTVIDPDNKQVSGHDDVVKFLDEYGLLICTYIYNKDRYGQLLDLRWALGESEQEDLMEMIIKGGGHHAGAIVPAMRERKSYASLNKPDTYHDGMFGHPGFVAVGQRLVFPEFVTKEQARGYTDTIICWLAVMNSFVEFSENDFNGGDPLQVYDRPSLKEFLKNCALAALGSTDAIDYLNEANNRTYCAEFTYIGLNTPVYPFNKQGLSLLLDGDEAKVTELLKLQDRQNNRKVNLLSKTSNNPEFKFFNIQMPVVPEDLPPLDVLMEQHGQTIEVSSIPFPPFTLSQVVRRAVKTLLPREAHVNDVLVAQAQANLFASLEPLILKQLGITLPPTPPTEIPGVPPVDYPMQPQPEVPLDPKIVSVREFMGFVQNQLQQPYDSYEAFDAAVDEIMVKADEFLGATNVKYFVPPRIYIDLGQNDGDNNLPSGWGFNLETVGALIYRGAIRDNVPQLDNKTNVEAPQEIEDSKHPFKTAAFSW